MDVESFNNRERASRAEYMREWRSKNPEKRTMHHERNIARARALERLADRYPGVLAALYAEECDKAGLPRVGTLPVGRPRKQRSVLAEEASA